MADEGRRNGNGTALGAISRVTHHIIEALSPQFLALLILNGVLFGVFIWYVDARADNTAHVIQQLLDSCLQQKSTPNLTPEIRPR